MSRKGGKLDVFNTDPMTSFGDGRNRIMNKEFCAHDDNDIGYSEEDTNGLMT